MPIVALIKSEIEKSQFVKKIALKMKVGEEAVWGDLKKVSLPTGEEKTNYYGGTSDKPPKAVNLERMLAGIIFWEESLDKSSKSLREKWQKIIGKDGVAEILESLEEDREALIFETERYNTDGDIKKTSEDIMKRVELEYLKQKLQKTTVTLDDKDISKEEERGTKAELEQIQKRIKELNN